MEKVNMSGEMEESIMVNICLINLFYFLTPKGCYKNDKKHGFGNYKWPDGRRYIGFWENGKQHGYAKYVMHNGVVKFGKWEAGKRVNWLTDEECEALKLKQNFAVLFS